jgi:hypothetical protein
MTLRAIPTPTPPDMPIKLPHPRRRARKTPSSVVPCAIMNYGSIFYSASLLALRNAALDADTNLRFVPQLTNYTLSIFNYNPICSLTNPTRWFRQGILRIADTFH